MKEKKTPTQAYHFKKIPFPPQLTIDEAENSVNRINGLFGSIRQELSEFNDRHGYLLLGYKNMPAFVKSRISEVTPRNVHELLKASKTEIDLGLKMPVGTVPYLALRILTSFPVDIMKKLWLKASEECLTGESIISALNRVANEYKVTKRWFSLFLTRE